MAAPRKTAPARTLRRNSTPSEQKLWKHLRNRRFRNLKFKRQVPVGTYIEDFCCIEKHLIVELDGGSHAFKKDYERVREEWLVAHGWTVQHFSNNLVMHHIEYVLHVLGVMVTSKNMSEIEDIAAFESYSQQV